MTIKLVQKVLHQEKKIDPLKFAVKQLITSDTHTGAPVLPSRPATPGWPVGP